MSNKVERIKGAVPVIGMIHGDLTITAFERNGIGYSVNCTCPCGTHKRIAFRGFTRGKGFDCCVIRRGDAKAYRASLHDAFHRCRRNAKKRRHVFTLTVELFEYLAKSDCYYCGAAPGNTALSSNFYRRKKAGILIRERFTFSGIDRIDNSLGYIESNVRPACKACNYAKGKLSASEFFELCARVTARAGLRRDVFD